MSDATLAADRLRLALEELTTAAENLAESNPEVIGYPEILKAFEAAIRRARRVLKAAR